MPVRPIVGYGTYMNLALEFVILGFVLAIFGLSLYNHLHPWMPEGETTEENWECQNCGFIVYSATIEGLVEGMRIHTTISDCEFEFDEDTNFDI